jgi:hypothetical protein
MIKLSVGGRAGAVSKAEGSIAMRSLGMLITSDRYFNYVAGIVTAAHAKGLAVYLYLTGTALYLIDLPEFSSIWKKAERVVSLENVTPPAAGRTGTDARSLPAADSEDLSRLLGACDRHIVL